MDIQGVNAFNLIAMVIMFAAASILFITVDSWTASHIIDDVLKNRGILDTMLANQDAGTERDAEMIAVLEGLPKAAEEADWAVAPDAPETADGSGTITEVHDADTIVIDGETFQVSLVDAPEEGQDGAAEAAALVGAVCRAGSVAHYDIDGSQPVDAYGRNLAMIWCGTMDVSLNRLLLDTGHGAVLERYCGDSEFEALLCE